MYGFVSLRFRWVTVTSFFLAGGRCPTDPPIFGWGGKASPAAPPKRSSAAFDRGGQTGPPRSNAFFVGAVDDTGAVDDMGAADDRPTTRSKVHLRRLQNAVI